MLINMWCVFRDTKICNDKYGKSSGPVARSFSNKSQEQWYFSHFIDIFMHFIDADVERYDKHFLCIFCSSGFFYVRRNLPKELYCRKGYTFTIFPLYTDSYKNSKEIVININKGNEH